MSINHTTEAENLPTSTTPSTLLKIQFIDIIKKLESKYMYKVNDIISEYVQFSLTELGYKKDLEKSIELDTDKKDLFLELLEIHRKILQSSEPFDILGYVLMGGHMRGNKGYKGNAYTGQFFTENKVTDALAEMSLIKLSSIYAKQGFNSNKFIKIAEPSSGTGAFIISLVKKIKELNKQGMPFSIDMYEFTAIELNIITSYMLLLQMILLDINARVVNGNSITKEIFNSWVLNCSTNDTTYTTNKQSTYTNIEEINLECDICESVSTNNIEYQSATKEEIHEDSIYGGLFAL